MGWRGRAAGIAGGLGGAPMNYGFPDMAKILKPAKQGVAEITHYEITKFDVLRELMHGGPAPAEPGSKIAILRVNGRTMMSDTRMERLTNWKVKNEARGNVLIAGLGIGMILHTIIAKPEVNTVTVIEKEADVIALIKPTLPQKKWTVINADIFTWTPPPGMKYDCIYFDIWADASNGSATPDRRKLSGRFRKYKAEGGWMGSWHTMSYR